MDPSSPPPETPPRSFPPELRLVATLGVLAAGALGFIAVAEDLMEGEIQGFDRAVLLALRRPDDPATPIGPVWLQHALADLTALGGYAVLALVVAAVASYLVAEGKRRHAALVVAAVGSGAVLSELLKLGFNRARPDVVERLTYAVSASFPSGHATLSAVTYLTLGALLARAHRRWRVKTLVLGWSAALSLLVGVSRIYLGVHWPTDVLAGWSLGAAWAALWWLVALRLDRRSAPALKP